jgi:hypothetical protein
VGVWVNPPSLREKRWPKIRNDGGTDPASTFREREQLPRGNSRAPKHPTFQHLYSSDRTPVLAAQGEADGGVLS